MINKTFSTIIGLPFVLVGFFCGLFLLPFYSLFHYFYHNIAYGSWTIGDSELLKEQWVNVLTLPRILRKIWKNEK